MSVRNKHPECLPDEVFITNADNETWNRINWKTKRKGVVAYMRNGEEIGSRWRGCFPVFVKKREIAASNPQTLRRIEERQD